jgi:pyridoxal phosphate enzyme (YggS family)
MSPVEQHLRHNLDQVQHRITAACQRVGRNPADVTLVAVTKYANPDWIAPLVSLGVSDLGENRPQQLVERAAIVPHARWHLIGQLQRNKVRSTLPHTVLIHSVDSLRLLQRISDIAGELGHTVPVLLQVNVSGEASKQGFAPDDLRRDWPACQALPHVQINGLMTMAPLADNPEESRPTFRGLRELRDEFGPHASPMLSMGMSHDMEVAIEEGATLVRIGSALFEGLERIPSGTA